MTCFSKNTSLILFQLGWYFAEVQGFESDDDIISIVMKKNLNEYTKKAWQRQSQEGKYGL